ncbi:hypothetical protein E8L99_16505 [Phreatobacter aquaticus]|uniref:Uncharacterized protein n=1 Tax=Phreatobacter aquaticus TaxID=2570229 RepID=A0A4D7QMP2_9HYPH|nr:hypothetical protein [Phreatobacter aquaticus]QCK87243.1 hypothetical protein E8L99_16505 [Phreatobacter aquaticus]
MIGGTFFTKALGKIHGGIDQAFGEPVQLQPQVTKPNYGTQPDPSRPPVTFTAVVHLDSGPRHLGKMGSRDHEPIVTTRGPCLHFDASQLPYQPQRGDRILHLNSSRVFEVRTVLKSGTGRTELELTQLGIDTPDPL